MADNGNEETTDNKDSEPEGHHPPSRPGTPTQGIATNMGPSAPDQAYLDEEERRRHMYKTVRTIIFTNKFVRNIAKAAKKKEKTSVGGEKLIQSKNKRATQPWLEKPGYAPYEKIVDPADMHRRFIFDVALLEKRKTEGYFVNEDDIAENIFDICDIDDTEAQIIVSEDYFGNFINSIPFRATIFILIAINAVIVGVQTNPEVGVAYRDVFTLFDGVVMAIFTWEILVKWFHNFWIFWKVGWNILDFAIIVTLLFGPQVSFLSSSRVFRILRIVRVVRGLRSMSALAGLSMAVQTVIQSIPDMANIFLLLIIVLTVFGVAGNVLFLKVLPEWFGSLGKTMYSLFICVTQDGWVDIYKLFKEQGPGNAVGGGIYFFFSILIGAFVFANLVVAVVVTNLEMQIRDMKAEENKNIDAMGTEVLVTGETVAAQNVPIIDIEDHLVEDGRFLHPHPAPLLISTMKGLSPDILERYFFILTCLEQNLVEYTQLRDDIKEIYEVARCLNEENPLKPRKSPSQEDGSPVDRDMRRASTASQNIIPLNIDLKKGDILSNLMKLEESNLIHSKSNNLQSVLKSGLKSQRVFKSISDISLGSQASLHRRKSFGRPSLSTPSNSQLLKVNPSEEDVEKGTRSSDSRSDML